MSRPAALALATLLLSQALLGCSSSKDQPIITVGSQKVTVAEYERVARGNQAQYEGLPAVAKATFVQDLERRALMLEQAHRLGHDHSSVMQNADREFEERALLQALIARIGTSAQRVSDAEARALYEARKVEAQVWLLYTSSAQAAQTALARLRAGEPFDKVSASYSVPGLLPPDGNMGWMSPGTLPDPLDGAMRTQKVNEVGGPFQVREGWYLLEVTERRPHEQGPFESMRTALVELMRQRKERAARIRAYNDLRSDYDFQPAPGGAQLLFRVQSAVAPVTPTPDQLQMPLATYRGGLFTLKDALTDLQRAETRRPMFNLLPAVEIWIEQQTMIRVYLAEARRRHLNEEPDIVNGLRAQREQLLLNGIYQNAVATVPPPGPELVQMAWERVRHMYTKLDAAHVAILELTDSLAVERLLAQKAATASLAEAAKNVDPSLEVKETTVKYPNDDPEWQVLTAMFTQGQPGAWFGPEQRSKGWRFIQLLDKQMTEQKFEDLPQGLQQNIAGSAGELARDARFKQFTDSLATAFHPVVDRALIAKLPWPVAADAAR